MLFSSRRGSCSILCFKPPENLHLPGTHSLCGSQLITSEIIGNNILDSSD
jgi:hypothetical protein